VRDPQVREISPAGENCKDSPENKNEQNPGQCLSYDGKDHPSFGIESETLHPNQKTPVSENGSSQAQAGEWKGWCRQDFGSPGSQEKQGQQGDDQDNEKRNLHLPGRIAVTASKRQNFSDPESIRLFPEDLVGLVS
jgi:hypothetical protein